MERDDLVVRQFREVAVSQGDLRVDVGVDGVVVGRAIAVCELGNEFVESDTGLLALSE